MPLYNYKCATCEYEFEAQKTIAERKTAACPRCKRGVGEQQLTVAHFAYLKMGTDASMPTAYAKWTKAHEQSGSKKHLGITEE